ncbi:MAG: nucleotidyltransferase [Dehalococcoidia bacterium]|nr:MAG: nucleotidyltransferase [Dehalococcoidia bacterium]
MKGVVLVGGEGTRLRPLTLHLPKPVVPIVNRPFLERMVRWMSGYGVREIILALGYLPDKIRERLGDGGALGVNLAYSVEEAPLGTAGAVKHAAGYLTDTCFVFNGDILTDLDLAAMLAAHRRAQAVVSIALTPVDDPTQYGVVEFDAEGRVQRFVEKPRPDEVRSHYINAGTYLIEPAVLERVPAGQYWMFERQLFPELVAAGERVFAFPTDAYWIDIGTPEKYRQVHADLLAGRLGDHLGNPHGDGLWAGDGCQIDPSATLIGPVALGDRVRIGPGVVVSGPTVIGADSVIGANAHVAESILWERVQVGEGAIVSECIIANDCRVECQAYRAILGARVVVEPGNRLDRGIRVWPERVIPRDTLRFG